MLESHSELKLEPQTHLFALDRQRKGLTEIRESSLCEEKRIFHSQVWKVCLLQHLDYLVFKVNMHSFKTVIKTLLYANHTGVVYKSLWGTEKYE